MRRVNILQTKKLRSSEQNKRCPVGKIFPWDPPTAFEDVQPGESLSLLHPPVQTKRASSHLSQGSIRTCALSLTIIQQRWRLKNLSLKVFKTESVMPKVHLPM